MKEKHNSSASGAKLIHPKGHAEPIMLQKRKGSNPRKEKLPALKCPVCKKFLFSVPDKQTLNMLYPYDLQNEFFSEIQPYYTHRCSRCHTMLGVLFLDRETWNQVKSAIAEKILQIWEEDEQLENWYVCEQFNIGYD